MSGIRQGVPKSHSQTLIGNLSNARRELTFWDDCDRYNQQQELSGAAATKLLPLRLTQQ